MNNNPKQKGGNIMPFGDGRGPRGMGPRSGRGLGYCAGFDSPGYANPGQGYGRGFGRGRGRGFGFKASWRNQEAPAYGPAYRAGFSGQPVELDAKEKLKILKAEKEDIAQEMKAIEDEIKKLQRKK
jgi:hypothetical protein